MTALQTPAAGQVGDTTLPAAGHQPTVFIFERPTQDEIQRRLDALDAARHAAHTQPARFCPLCPPAVAA